MGYPNKAVFVLFQVTWTVPRVVGRTLARTTSAVYYTTYVN